MRFQITSAMMMVAMMSTAAFAQPAPPVANVQLAPGISMRPDNGVIDLPGGAFVEVNHYDISWSIAQQHDRVEPIQPAPDAPKPPEGTHVFKANFSTTPPAVIEQTVTSKDGGIQYVMTFKAEKEIATNELSATILLSVENFGGKTMKVDGVAQVLPMTAQAAGQARILEKPEAQKVEIPMPDGTLVITGKFKFLLQDDREWGDTRYSMRLGFTPFEGAIKDAKVDLQMKIEKPM